MPEEVSEVNTVPSPANSTEARAMLFAALGFLNAADATEMRTGEQARWLQALEQGNSMIIAGRASALAAFIAGQGYSADADYSPRSWLIHRTRITKGAATAHTAWARRAMTHPQVTAAMASGQVVSESYARTICEWSDKVPEECRPAADAILIAAAKAGAAGARDVIPAWPTSTLTSGSRTFPSMPSWRACGRPGATRWTWACRTARRAVSPTR